MTFVSLKEEMTQARRIGKRLAPHQKTGMKKLSGDFAPESFSFIDLAI